MRVRQLIPTRFATTHRPSYWGQDLGPIRTRWWMWRGRCFWVRHTPMNDQREWTTRSSDDA